MQHKSRQSKTNSPLLLQSDCSLLASVLLFFVLEIRIRLALWVFSLKCHSHRFIASSLKERTTGIWLYRQIAKCNFVHVLSWLYFLAWSLKPQQYHSFLAIFRLFVLDLLYLPTSYLNKIRHIIYFMHLLLYLTVEAERYMCFILKTSTLSLEISWLV